MPIQFPTGPTTGQTFTPTGTSKSYTFNGTVWVTDNIPTEITPTALNGLAGNGTEGQFLSSDGDGTFSWVDAPSGGGASTVDRISVPSMTVGQNANTNTFNTSTFPWAGGNGASITYTASSGTLAGNGFGNNYTLTVQLVTGSTAVTIGSISTTQSGTQTFSGGTFSDAEVEGLDSTATEASIRVTFGSGTSTSTSQGQRPISFTVQITPLNITSRSLTLV